MPSAGEGGEEGDGDGDGEGADGKAGGRRRKAGSADPSSTLAATWEELNAKKFDLAFAVDPLFHKTSAQFDEGGARGAPPGTPCGSAQQTGLAPSCKIFATLMVRPGGPLHLVCLHTAPLGPGSAGSVRLSWNYVGRLAGLLLNNLSVYRGCEVLFDSLEVPEDAVDEADQRDAPDTMVRRSGCQSQASARQASWDPT